MNLLNIGEKAPSFQLSNQDNLLISLDQYLGKWVIIYFYPKAMTPGCTVQACGIRDKMSDLTSLGAVVMGISPDKPPALKKFVEHDNLNFQLLSDLEHQVAESYGTWQEKSMYGRTYMGMARTTYIIDPEGVIRCVIPKADPKTHTDDIIEFLKENAA